MKSYYYRWALQTGRPVMPANFRIFYLNPIVEGYLIYVLVFILTLLGRGIEIYSYRDEFFLAVNPVMTGCRNLCMNFKS